MAMQEIAKSNEQQVDANINNVDVKNLTKADAEKLATDIVTDSSNAEQIKVFPDLWNSLNDQQKSEFVSKLE
jgi:predicted rRNA methylase YqxC with S4 and FtsJ domains